MMINSTITIPKLSIISGLWLAITDMSNTRHIEKKKDEKLLPVAWHPTRA